MDTDLYFLYEEGKDEASCHELTNEEVESLVPCGDYCYERIETSSLENLGGKIKKCPFWDILPTLPEQTNGFCHLMKVGDFTKEGTALLWDQVKCCGVNLSEER